MYLKHLQQKNNDRGVRVVKNPGRSAIPLIIIWL
jgi:hypothetical protein